MSATITGGYPPRGASLGSSIIKKLSTIAGLGNPKPKRCCFINVLSNQCTRNALPGMNVCAYHAPDKCSECGKQATKNCNVPSCCQNLCDSCSHDHSH